MKIGHWILGIALISLFWTAACGKKPDDAALGPAEKQPPGPEAAPPAVPAPEPDKPLTQNALLKADALAQNIVSGLAMADGALALYRFKDDFSTDTRTNYKTQLNSSYGKDEYGVVDPNVDAALVTHQKTPDNSFLVETYDNDSVSLSMGVVPTVKGFLSLDIWPVRLWPTSGRVTLEVRDTGQRRIVFPLAGSDYRNPTTKQFDGKTLSVKGGKPFFSSIRKHNIYQPNEVIPSSERRWWPMRLLFRPDYVAGYLDDSVCREIDDPDKQKIITNRVELSFNQIETYIRALRFKALLGETVSPILELTGPAWVSVDWDGDAPEKTRIGLQLRGTDSMDETDNAPWNGPEDNSPYFLKPGPVPDTLKTKKFLQVRILLKADQEADFEVSPALRSITIAQEGN